MVTPEFANLNFRLRLHFLGRCKNLFATVCKHDWTASERLRLITYPIRIFQERSDSAPFQKSPHGFRDATESYPL